MPNAQHSQDDQKITRKNLELKIIQSLQMALEEQSTKSKKLSNGVSDMKHANDNIKTFGKLIPEIGTWELIRQLRGDIREAQKKGKYHEVASLARQMKRLSF